MHDPISYFQAVVLGLLQGVAEPFPISSLGHRVILPKLAGWHIHQNDKFFLTFLLAPHRATAIARLFCLPRAAQAAALVRGISRSGITMGGGLVVGLSNEMAARYSFLLATPIIGAAAILKLPELFGSAGNGVRGPALVGALGAALTTFFAVK